MTDLSLAHISPDLLPAGRYATAVLHALAREERTERKPERLLEDGHGTWRQFRGRMGPVDFMELLLEDAAVTQPFAFDPLAVMGPEGRRVGRLPESRVGLWLDAVKAMDLAQPAEDYVADQARRLGLPARLARSELHRGVRSHHRILELPGTGGQLAAYLAQNVDGVYLQDVFAIAWSDWLDRLLAGLVAVEAGITGDAPIAPDAGIDALRESGTRFDYVIGAAPERGAQPHDQEALETWFPGATVVLV